MSTGKITQLYLKVDVTTCQLPRLLACAAILTELNRRLRSRSTTRPNCSYPTDQPPPRFFIPGPFDLSVRARSGTRLDQRAGRRGARHPATGDACPPSPAVPNPPPTAFARLPARPGRLVSNHTTTQARTHAVPPAVWSAVTPHRLLPLPFSYITPSPASPTPISAPPPLLPSPSSSSPPLPSKNSIRVIKSIITNQVGHW